MSSISSAEAPFKIGEKNFNAGSYIIRAEGNPRAWPQRIAKEAAELGLTATAVDKLPDVAQHAVGVPRVAIVHTWINTQDEGWYRVEFDRLGIPYDYISDQTFGRTPDLRSKWDVIVFGPVRTSAQNIVRGQPKFGPKRGPDPMEKIGPDAEFGNVARPNRRHARRDGDPGIANLQKFIEDGGLFVTVGDNASIPIDFGLTSGVSVQNAKQLQARGSVINTVFADRKSPIAYGYDEKLAVYFNQSPLLQVANFTPGAGFGGGAVQRPVRTARAAAAGVDDPDIVQGRPLPEPIRSVMPLDRRPPRRSRRLRSGRGSFCGSLRKKSCWLAECSPAASELAGKAAVVDVPVGRGHVVMFANNPMWRHETHGSFSMLFNAILNYDNLGVGRTEPRTATEPAKSDEEQ